MSFEKLEAAITAEAETEARRTVDAARAEAEAMIARSREEGESVFEDAVRSAETAAARETARQVGLARHEGRLEVLQAKNRLIDRVFRDAEQWVGTLSDGDYLSLLEGWLKKLPPEAGGMLRVNPRDGKRLSRGFLDRVNTGRPAEGRFTGVETDDRIQAGFVVSGGAYTVDFTVENLMNELRDSLAGELAKELFGS
jgi:V/A-type H+/Na+-transporting ATPase subunit E